MMTDTGVWAGFLTTPCRAFRAPARSLRLVRQDTLITGYWSSDGSDSIRVAETHADLVEARIGLYADNSLPGRATVPAYFDQFRVGPAAP